MREEIQAYKRERILQEAVALFYARGFTGTTLDDIAAELRSQYNIGYTSTNPVRDGSFRKVEIKPKPEQYKIQSRSGYYALAHGQE